MRIATYRSDGRIEVGALSQDGSAITPYDLSPKRAASGVLALVEADPALLPMRDVDHPLSFDTIELLAPIPRPRRNIICVGKNYYAHVQEIANQGFDTTGGGAEPPSAPIIFSKFPDCVTGSGAPIRYDQRVTQQLDYEAELGVIVGREGRAISQVDAMEHVWGYTIVNDVSARDVQRRHNQWLLGKSQDGFCPMGPFAVTRDLLDLADTPIRCWVNDELRQDGNTNLMMFDIPTLIEAISAGLPCTRVT